MALTTEQLTVIRSSLDPSGYVAGAQKIVEANTKVAASGDQVVQTTTKTTRALVDSGTSFDRYRKQVDDAYAAQVKLQQVQTAAQRAVAAGRATQDEANATIAAFSKRMADVQTTVTSGAASTNKLSFAMRDLGLQSIDAFQGLATGQPIMRTLIQQGAQVVQVNAAMGVSFGQMARATASALLSLAANPLVLFATAAATVVASIVALGSASETSAKQTAALQNALRATRDDYVSLAAEVTAASKAIAATTGIGTADARAAGQTIASASNFQGSQAQLESLIKTAGDLAAVMGKTVPEAAKDLANALQDPGAEAKKLADQHFPGMSQALAYNIKLMADGGDKAGAFARELQVIQAQTKGANDNLTPLQQALRGLSEAFTKTGQDGRSLADSIGSVITSAAALAINAITGVINGIEQLRQNALRGIGGTPVTPQGAAALTPDATGRSVLTSSRGALGLFQVLPSTAAQYGLNPNVQDQNILAGLSYIRDLASKTPAEADIAGGYNMGPTGYKNNPAGAASYIQSVRTANAASLPADVASQIEYWGQVLGLPADMIALGQRIAVVESGGRQYRTSSSTEAPRTSSGISTPGFAAALAGSGVGGIEGGLAQLQSGNAINDAFSAYLKSGVLSIQQAQNQATQSQLQQGISAANSIGDIDTVQKLTEALAKLRGEETDLITEQQKLARSATDSVAALSAQSGFTRTMAEIEQQFAVAARASGRAVDEKALALTKAAKQTQLATDYSDAVKATNLATEAQLRINAAYDGTVESLTHATDIEKAYALAREKFDEKSPDFSRHVLQYADALDRSSASARSLQQAQQSVQALSDTLSNAFDRLGQSLVDAFVSGSGQAVNFGNIMRGLVSSIAADMVKLAVINPILNSILPSTSGARPTLGAALGVLNGGGATGTAAGSGSSLLGSGGDLLSVGSAGSKLLGLDIGKSLGLTGDNGLFSGVSSFLNGGIFGTSAAEANTAGLIAGGFGPGQALGVVDSAPTGLLGGTSIGSALGAVGAIGGGYSIGSLAGGYLQSALNKTGPGPQIGAGAGALAGAAIGSVVPVIGTALGAILGGVLGGAGGGLIGPRPASPYTSTSVNVQNGQLNVGNTYSQIADAAQERAGAIADANVLNAFLKQTNTSLNSIAPLGQIGQNTPDGYQDPSKFQDIATAFPNFRFAANDNEVNQGLAGRSFASFAELQNVVSVLSAVSSAKSSTNSEVAGALTGRSFGSTDEVQTVVTALSQFVDDVQGKGVYAKGFLDNLTGVANADLPGQLATIDQFITQTVPALEGFGKNTGTLNQQIDAINAQFDPAIAMAQQLGIAEGALTGARREAIQATQDAAAASLQGLLDQYGVRAATAAGQASGDPTQQQGAALWAFDRQAWQERTQLDAQLAATYGDGFRLSQQYSDAMVALQAAQDQERLALQKQYGDQATQLAQQQAQQQAQVQQQAAQSAGAAVTSIISYVQGLQTGSNSALSPTAQYSLASRQFDAVSGAALSGDFNSIQQITSYSDALLNASRGVNGGGAGYASDFTKVINVLSQIASKPADSLTASAFASITNSQTQQIVNSQQQLADLLTSLLQEIRQQGNRPARLAA